MLQNSHNTHGPVPVVGATAGDPISANVGVVERRDTLVRPGSGRGARGKVDAGHVRVGTGVGVRLGKAKCLGVGSRERGGCNEREEEGDEPSAGDGEAHCGGVCCEWG